MGQISLEYIKLNRQKQKGEEKKRKKKLPPSLCQFSMIFQQNLYGRNREYASCSRSAEKLQNKVWLESMRVYSLQAGRVCQWCGSRVQHLRCSSGISGFLWIQPSSLLRLEGEESLQISVSSSKSVTLCTSNLFHHSFREEKWGYQKELVTSSALHMCPTSYHYNLSQRASPVQGDTYKVKVRDQNRRRIMAHYWKSDKHFLCTLHLYTKLYRS